MHLTRVLGHKPTVQDIKTWEEEAAKHAMLIKTSLFPQRNEYGHLAIIIPKDEYCLKINNDTFVYKDPQDPGPYPQLDGNKTDNEIKLLEAKHKVKTQDYQKYLGVQEFCQEFQKCIDPTWINALKCPHGKFSNITTK